MRIDADMPEIAARDRALTEFKKAFSDYVYDSSLNW
jgi:hypothetical protein